MLMNSKQGKAHGNNLSVIHESTALRPQGILFVRLCFHRPARILPLQERIWALEHSSSGFKVGNTGLVSCQLLLQE